jgi:hypothetical protein
LAGKTATISFYAKSSVARDYTVQFVQDFGSGGSSQVGVSPSVSIGTTWSKITSTVNIPSISGKTIGDGNHLYVRIYGSMNTGDTLDVAQVQLEEGSYATPFEYRPIGEELALCKRYFQKVGGRVANEFVGTGYAVDTDTLSISLKTHGDMRVAPTRTLTGTIGNFIAIGNGSSITSMTASAMGSGSSSHAPVITLTKTGSFTQYEHYTVTTGATATDCIWLDAEL